VLVRGSNSLVIDEAERSIHDALCVIRSLVKKQRLDYGGESAELNIATRFQQSIISAKGLELLLSLETGTQKERNIAELV